MKIRELIHELQKEVSRGDEEIFVMVNDTDVYDFDLGIDINGQSLIMAHKYLNSYSN